MNNNLKNFIKKIIKEELVKEADSFKKLDVSIKITYDIQMTQHAIERKMRHLDDEGVIIKDKDIIDLIDKALPKLTTDMVKNTLNVGDEMVLTSKSNNLNVVGILKSGNGNEINFIIKTIMIKPGFKPDSTKQYFF